MFPVVERNTAKDFHLTRRTRRASFLQLQHIIPTTTHLIPAISRDSQQPSKTADKMPDMYAIQPPKPTSPKDNSTLQCTPNIIPCRIHHDGPIDTARYWTLTKDEKGTIWAVGKSHHHALERHRI